LRLSVIKLNFKFQTLDIKKFYHFDKLKMIELFAFE
jgi:hypothetical protein